MSRNELTCGLGFTHTYKSQKGYESFMSPAKYNIWAPLKLLEVANE